MSEPVSIKFKKSHPPYNVGETAGFAPDKAAFLVTAGTANYANRMVALRARTHTAWTWLRHPTTTFRQWYRTDLHAYISPRGSPNYEIMMTEGSAPAIRIKRAVKWLEKNWPSMARDVVVLVIAAVVGAIVLLLLGLA